MFGNVNILSDELKMKEYRMYRAYYCGVCKSIGKGYGGAYRLSLNYDITFLALLLSAVTESDTKTACKRCVVHMRKQHIVMDSAAVDYAAGMNILLTYFKLVDNAIDSRNPLYKLPPAAFALAVRKARREYPEAFTHINELLQVQRTAELSQESSIDKAAHPFALILQRIFAPEFIPERERLILGNIGYNIGRWLYILDAFNDIDDDVKKRSYNPFVYANVHTDRQQLAEVVYNTLTSALADASASYNLLEIKQHDSILRNILYLGLRDKTEKIRSLGDVSPD